MLGVLGLLDLSAQRLHLGLVRLGQLGPLFGVGLDPGFADLMEKTLVILRAERELLQHGLDLRGHAAAVADDFKQRLLHSLLVDDHALGELQLLLRGEQGHLADLLEVHAHRIVGGEAVHHRIRIGELLCGLLDLHELLRVGQILVDRGQIVGNVHFDAVLLQGLIEFADAVAVEVHLLQALELLGRDLAVFPALLEKLGQALLRILDGLRILLLLGGAFPGLGQLRLRLGSQIVGGRLLQKLVCHALQFFLGEIVVLVHLWVPLSFSLSFSACLRMSRVISHRLSQAGDYYFC